MIDTKLGIVGWLSDTKAIIYLKKAMDCKRCKRAVMVIINEMGQTRCTTCPEPGEIE